MTLSLLGAPACDRRKEIEMRPPKLVPKLLALSLLLVCGLAKALVFSVGPPTTTIPSYFGSVTLGADQFLVPINVSGAAQLQDWQFDFSFDPAVVTQIEPFFTPYSFGVYAAQFDPSDANSLSSLTSAGFTFVAGRIEQIAGFSQGATGDGPLVFLAFETLQPDSDPGFSVSSASAIQAVPEPSTWVLLAVGMTGLALCRRVAKAGAERAVQAYPSRR